MQIIIKKGKDQVHSLTCLRIDGTSTWTKIKGDFGPMHDIAHYVVETTFGLDGGFYGLLAQGYDISSFVEEEDKSWIGTEGLYVESLVMGLQYNFNGVATDDEFDAVVNDASRQYQIEPWIELNAERVEVLKERYMRLIAQWHQLQPGASLNLTFPDKALQIL